MRLYLASTRSKRNGQCPACEFITATSWRIVNAEAKCEGIVMVMLFLQLWIKTMMQTEKRFFQNVGRRVAQFRKEWNLTQVQLAEMFGISSEMRETVLQQASR